MSTADLKLKITADAKSAVSGINTLTTSLEGVTKTADKTEAALKDLDKKHTIDLNDQAVDKAKKDLAKLKTQLAREMDLGIDTRETNKRIRTVKSNINALDDKSLKIKAKIDVDDSGLKAGTGRFRSLKGIGSELTSSLTGATGALGGVAAAAGPAGIAIAAVGGAAIIGVKGIKALANQASDLEQAIGGADSVFKDTSQAMQDYARTADQTAGLSTKAYLEMSTVVGAQLKNLGFSISEAAGMASDLIERSADLSAAFGGSTAEAAEAVASALRGEMDPIERYGISLSEMMIKNKAMADGLWDGKGSIDAHAKALTVNALIMEQSADAAGQFARESDSLAGQQAKLNAEFENMTTNLGQNVLPLVTDFATVANYLTIQLGELTAEGGKLNSMWSSIPGPLKALGKVAAGVLNPITGLVIGVHEWAGEIDKIPPKLAPVTAAQQALSKENNDLAYSYGIAGKAAADAAGEIEGMVVGSEDYDKAIGKTLASLRQLVPGLESFTDEQVTGTGITQDQADAFDELKTSISGIQGSIQESVSSFTDLSDIFKTITKDGKKAFSADAFIAEQKKRNQAITDWQKNLTSLADKGLSQKVIDNLAGMGIEGGGALVDSLANKTSDAQLSKIGKNWTFGQSLGEQIGGQIAVAMVDAMDGKIDGLLNGKKIPVPELELPKSHGQKLKDQFDKMVSGIKKGLSKGVPVNADIKAAEKKLKALQAEAEKHPKNKKINADVAAAKAKLRELKAQAEKKVTKPIHADDSAARATGSSLNSYLSSSVTKDVFINWPKIPKALNDYLSNPIVTAGQTMVLVPQVPETTAATLAGLRTASLAAPQMVATTASQTSTRPGAAPRATVTQIAPRSTPVKIYLDGAEIADHLSLKAGRMASVPSVRRRA